MGRRALAWVAVAAGALALAGVSASQAATAPVIDSVVEGRDSETGRVVLWVVGKSVSKFKTASVSFGGNLVGAADLIYKSATLLALRLPVSVGAGAYDVTLAPGDQVRHLSLNAGSVPPGAITSAALSGSLRGDLDDSATVGGRPASDFALATAALAKAGGTMTGLLTVNTTTGNSISASATAAAGKAVVGRATDTNG